MSSVTSTLSSGSAGGGGESFLFPPNLALGLFISGRWTGVFFSVVGGVGSGLFGSGLLGSGLFGSGLVAFCTAAACSRSCCKVSSLYEAMYFLGVLSCCCGVDGLDPVGLGGKGDAC